MAHQSTVTLPARRRPSANALRSSHGNIARVTSYTLAVNARRQWGRHHSPHSTRHGTHLQAAIRYTPVSKVREDRWIGALSAAMLSNSIQCTPGSFWANVTSRRVVQLVSITSNTKALAANPRSLKRAAIEAVDPPSHLPFPLHFHAAATTTISRNE